MNASYPYGMLAIDYERNQISLFYIFDIRGQNITFQPFPLYKHDLSDDRK